MTFDAYHRWLSIPPEEQPPHHYRLLGCKLFEEDADVIESAADRQMTHVRSFQSGGHAKESQKLLNAISAAKLVLLDAEKKSAYDARLKEHLKKLKKKRTAQKTPVATPLAMPVAQKEQTAATAAPVQIRKATSRKKSATPLVLAVAACLAALVLVGGAIAFAFLGNSPQIAGTNQTERDKGQTPGSGTSVVPAAPEKKNEEKKPTPPKEKIPPDQPAVIPVTDPVDEPKEEIDPETGIEEEEPPIVAEPRLPILPQKSPVPDAEARNKARAQIAELFPLDSAKSTEEKLELAARLLNTARESNSDPVAQFVLLNLARETAAEAAKMRLAFEAVDLLETNFAFNADTVRMATFRDGVKSSLPPKEKQEVVAAGLQMIDAMIAKDNYESAGELITSSLEISRRARDQQSLNLLIEYRKRVDALSKEHRSVQNALAALRESPADVEASLTAGKYYLFLKQDWDRALPLLANGGDSLLAAAAKLEMVGPVEAAQQEKLAEAWWDCAEDEKSAENKGICQNRSGHWYRKAVDGLAGLNAVKARQRLELLAKTDSPAIPSPSPVKPREPNLLDLIDIDNHKLSGNWVRTDEGISAPDSETISLLMIPVELAGSYEVNLLATVHQENYLIALVLPVGENRCSVIMLGQRNGIEMIDGRFIDENGTLLQGPVLEKEKRHLIQYRVEWSNTGACRINIAVDGEVKLAWEGKSGQLSTQDIRTPSRPRHLALYATQPATFHHAALRTLPGGAARIDADARK